jgi:hypothetical protein
MYTVQVHVYSIFVGNNAQESDLRHSFVRFDLYRINQ